MKLLKWTFLAATLLTFSLSACKKSASNAKVNNSLSLKFNGTAYSTSNVSGSYGSGVLQIIGTFNTPANVYLAVDSAKTGTFDLATHGSATFSLSQGNAYFVDSGTITITSFTGSTVAGTFQFNGTNISNGSTCVVTSGTFQTSYSNK